jgi:hypothetical protein
VRPPATPSHEDTPRAAAPKRNGFESLPPEVQARIDAAITASPPLPDEVISRLAKILYGGQK